MRLVRSVGTVAAVFVLAFALSLYSFQAARGSDHQDSPTVVANPLADITDVFAFPDPKNAKNVVLIMDVDPLIPAGMTAGHALDPNVLYQFKLATGIGSKNYKEDMVLQLRADKAGSGQKITLYGPSAPNEVGTKNTLVKSTGTFAFNKMTTLPGGIKAFAGPRREPFFFDLAQFFKILPDRNYMNHPNPPPATATSFLFASKNQKIVLNGTSYGTAGSNKCAIGKPADDLADFDVLSIVVEVPKTMLEPKGAALGVVGLWATTATPDGQAE
jgi:hypothetical protein